ncbi:MAG: glycoside hydrolase family 3 N-terminal domain-containing protein, partial [Luminiphilus sp.]
AVHGHNNVIGATIFPHNIGLGAARDPELVASISAATAREVKATGIDWIFAPTVAVARDFRWGRTYESYSSDEALVASYAGGMVEAMQAEGVVATAKHFVGDGGTHTGDDRGDTRLPLETLLGVHGAGYGPAIDAGVMTVMASFNRWNGDKVHGNKHLLTEVLRGQLGFEGFVVSDWNGIGEVEGCTDASCPQAINAGIDMVMVPEDWRAAINNLIFQVQSGAIPMARIDEAVHRILTTKIAAGLMDRGLPSKVASAYRDQVGSAQHRALARDAVRRSLVLLKNEQQLLPLDPGGNYLITGPGADNIGMQSGGWTISWQGTGNSNADFPVGTSIFSGLQQQIEAAGGRVFLAGSVPEDVSIDAVIAVYGERPYAEMQGDISTLAWQQPDFVDLEMLTQYQEQGL